MTSITDADVPFPDARVEHIVGLLEVLDEVGVRVRVDIFRLGRMLRLPIDSLLPILEGARLLRFVEIRDGNANLTRIGREMARADILERKKIFRKQALQVLLLHQVVGLLARQPGRRISRGQLLGWLETSLSELWAGRTLDILIDWGRYAEVLGYNARTGDVYLAANAVDLQDSGVPQQH